MHASPWDWGTSNSIQIPWSNYSLQNFKENVLDKVAKSAYIEFSNNKIIYYEDEDIYEFSLEPSYNIPRFRIKLGNGNSVGNKSTSLSSALHVCIEQRVW